MKKAIVTTTINPPTEALKKFIKIADADEWHLFIVGDKKTDDKPYYDIDTAMDCVTYLDCDAQEKISQELSDLIGWNCIQRRNFGLVAAYQWGADIISTVDDDNIPYEGWGRHCKVNRDIDVKLYKVDAPVFDPLSTVFPHLWHRGFPIQMLDDRNLKGGGMVKRRVLVQADMWNGAPDIDAICRITLNPMVQFPDVMIPFGADKPAPFNSQNTFLSRDVFPTYFLFPHIGRMDDIWAAYVVQAVFPDSVAFCKASVLQDRNPHDLTKDLEAELIGYRHSGDFANWLSESDMSQPTLDGAWPEYIPADTIKAYNVYKELFK